LPLSSNDTGQEDQADSRINIIMLGILCGYTHLLPRSALEHAIALRLPRFAGQNLRTFSAGWHLAEGLRSKNLA
jgi:Pyruvate/2-oxoacid:ferredoxin oxidoreductase gamma subunit